DHRRSRGQPGRCEQCRSVCATPRRLFRSREQAMMRRYNRLLVALFVIGDALLGMAAFLVAYLLRFEILDRFPPLHKGVPPFIQSLRIAPFIGLLVPIAFQVQGLYRLRRGRSRVDDFFGVFVGTILAVVLGLGGTLYYQTYFTPEPNKDVGLYEV